MRYEGSRGEVRDGESGVAATALPSHGRHQTLLMAILLFTLYLITGSGGFHIIDEVSLYSVTENLARRGAWDTDQIAWSQWVNSPAEVLGAWGADGHVYSKKGVAPALAFLPLRLLAGLLPGVGLLQTTFLSNALITILTALLLRGIALRLGYSTRLGTAAALIFGTATLAWPYANHLFGEPLSALCLTAALWAVLVYRQDGGWRPSLVLGAALAGAALTSAAYALLLPVFGLAWIVNQQGRREASRQSGRSFRLPAMSWSALLALALPLALAAGFWLWYNNLRFENPLVTGYHFAAGEGFNGPWRAGLYGLLFSPYRGIFYHQPLTLIAVIGFIPFWRRHRLVAFLTGVSSLLLLLIFAKWWIWWGGFAWGPRFLVPLAPFLTLWTLPLLAGRRRFWAWGVIGLSTCVQLLAVSANYVLWEIELRGLYPTDWRDPLLYGAPATHNPLHSPVFGQIMLLARTQWHAVIDFAWWQERGVLLWVPLLGLGLILLAGWGLWRWGQRRWAGQAVLILGLAALLFAYVTLRAMAADERYGPPTGYPAILNEIHASEQSSDAIVTVAPYHYHIPMNGYDGRLPVLGFAQEQPLRPETTRLLSQTLEASGSIYLITSGLPPADPSNGVEWWLNDHAFLADDRWFDDFRLLRYGAAPPTEPLPVGQVWGTPPALTLAQASISNRAAHPGDMLTFALAWQPEASLPDLHLFVQLLPAGAPPIAQLDRSYPTSTWRPAQTSHTRAALWIPTGAPAGEYTLILGWYDPATGTRLSIGQSSTAADFTTLAAIQITTR